MFCNILVIRLKDTAGPQIFSPKTNVGFRSEHPETIVMRGQQKPLAGSKRVAIERNKAATRTDNDRIICRANCCICGSERVDGTENDAFCRLTESTHLSEQAQTSVYFY